MIEQIENQQFLEFLRDKNRIHFNAIEGRNGYHIFKIPYDNDCVFLHVIRTYITDHDPIGKLRLGDKSELGCIYVPSIDTILNGEYPLKDFICKGNFSDAYRITSTDVKEYYRNLCRDINAEVVRHIEDGKFDRKKAAKLVEVDDREIKYYKEHKEYGYVERAFLEGETWDKPKIIIEYTSREHEIDSVLEYLRTPVEAIVTRVEQYMIAEQVKIYKAIVCAEVRFETMKAIMNDKTNPLHFQREIRRIVKDADVKTVNITFERNGTVVTAKTEAPKLGSWHYVSDYDIINGDRAEFKKIFNYNTGGDAKMHEILSITHGKKELYNKTEFEKTLV